MTETVRIGHGPAAAPKKGGRARLLALAGVATVVLGAGSAAAGIAVARRDARMVTPVPSASASAPAVSDPAGREACRLLVLAYDGDLLMDRSTVEDIQRSAVVSTTPAVQLGGHLLLDRQALAIAAKGAADEPRRVLAVQTQALEMRADCVRAGLG